MMYLHPVAMIPNDLINDTAVQYSTKRIAVALLLLSGRKNRSVTVSIAALARIARCSTTTVQQAIRELVNGGYIIKSRNYRWNERLGRLGYASNSYCWVRRTGGYTMVRREILGYDLTPAAFADRNYRWNERLGRLGYASNSYCWVRRTGGYTMVRREILGYDLTPAAFAELLYLYRCAGRAGRAFPSLRQIAGRMKAVCAAGLDMAKSTVCAAARALSVYLYRCAGRAGRAFPSLRQIAGRMKAVCAAGLDMAKSTVCAAARALSAAQAAIRKHCTKMDQSHAANSYYLTDLVVSRPGAASCVGGSPKSDKHIFINQITRDFNERKEKSGVAQFGSLTSFDEYEYDGTGVRVHVYAPYDELLA